MADHPRVGQVAVIFLSQHSGQDEAGYGATAGTLQELVAQQPGFLGVDWVGDANGREVTISYWADDASAAAWRRHPIHSQAQGDGRGRWLESYDLMVTRIERGHRWPGG